MENTRLYGIHNITIPKEHSSDGLYDLAKIISRSSFEEDYSTLYKALWPHIKSVYKKHYCDIINPKLLCNIRFELDQIYHFATQYVHPECFGIVNLAFKSCIHAAEQWDFDLEEG